MGDWQIYLALMLTAAVAGAVNSLAGGGTLLTFPALLTVVSPVFANGTSTVALMPGSLASAWAYRREVNSAFAWVKLLLAASAVGGLLGVLLVTRIEEKYFARLVPWLILTATLLMLLQPVFARFAQPRTEDQADPPRLIGPRLALIVLQFLIAIYGGYFGAGIGILMLGTLGVMGLHDIHVMNGVKTFLAMVINLMAAIVFIWDGYVVWRYSLAMMGAAIVGGYLGAHYGRRLNRELVRWFVVLVGFALATYYFLRGTPPDHFKTLTLMFLNQQSLL